MCWRYTGNCFPNTSVLYITGLSQEKDILDSQDPTELPNQLSLDETWCSSWLRTVEPLSRYRARHEYILPKLDGDRTSGTGNHI